MKWFRFYHDAIDDPKVQRLPGELFKFWINMLCLGSRSEDRGVIALDVEAIAFAVRVSDEDAAVMLAELVQRGLLEESGDGFGIHNWEGRQRKSDNVSERVAEHRSRKKGNDETLPETLQATPGETEKPSARDRGESETDTEQEPETEDATASEARAKRPSSPNQRFTAFWDAYPRKVGKGDAAKSFARLKPDAALFAEMMAALDRQKRSEQWQRENGRFVPNPATWINQTRWEDDLPPPSRAPTPLRQPPNLRTHGHDEDVDWLGDYAPPPKGASR